MLGMITNGISKISTMGVPGFLEPVIRVVVNFVAKLVYGVYFAIIKAIGWVLDILTQLFFIFSGMTPVSSTQLGEDGVAEKTDLANFFLGNDQFVEVYVRLCIIALVLIVVFAIGKIIKQDYFDRSGPRSKGPIFRNIALSFIAFICVIPIFYFLISAVSALAMLVMNAMGYEGGGVGSILFEMSWSDGGVEVADAGRRLGGTYDKTNFGWYHKDTFYEYYWDPTGALEMEKGGLFKNTTAEFYWYIFIFGGLILIVNLGQMLLAMVTRLYNLIALFIIAPSPISQIVLDDGAKFKQWKDKLLQEAFKVVGCVMGFMVFLLILNVVNNLDIARYAYTDEAASSISLLESNNLTQELSHSVSALYYGGADEEGVVDKLINALGKMMIIIAGVGAIKDMDGIITPLLVGGSSSMDLGNAGKAVANAGNTAVSGAMNIGRKAIGGAVSLASSAVSLGAGAGLSLAKGINKGKAAYDEGRRGNAADEDGSAAPDATTSATPSSPTPSPTGGSPEEASDAAGAESMPEAEGGPEEASDAAGAESVPEAEDGPEEASDAAGAESVPEAEDGPEEASDVPGTESVPEEASDAAGAESMPEAEDGPEEASDAAGAEGSSTTSKGNAQKTKGTPESKAKSNSKVRFGTLKNKPHGKLTARGKTAKFGLGVGAGALSFGLGLAGKTLKFGAKATGTALATGGSIAGIMAKSVLQMTGMDNIAEAAGGFASGVAKDTVGTVSRLGKNLKKQGADFAKSEMQLKKVNGNYVDKDGNAINEDGYRLDDKGEVMKDGNGEKVKGNGGPVYETAIGNMFGASKQKSNSVSKWAENAGFLGSKAIARKIEDSNWATKDVNVNNLVDNEVDQIEAAASRIGKGKVDSNEVSLQANAAIDASVSLMSDAESVSSSHEAVVGSRVDACDLNVEQAHEINRRYATAGQSSISEALRAKMQTLASDKERYSSVDHSISVDSYMKTINNDKDCKHKKKASIRNHGQEKRSIYMAKIADQSMALDKRYEAQIRAVDTARANGTTVNPETLSQYNEYLDKSKKLDLAYMYVDIGTEEGQQAFDGMKDWLDMSDDKARDSKNREFDPLAHSARISKRAQGGLQVGKMASQIIENTTSPGPEELEENASAATKLAAATERAKVARERYESAVSSNASEAVITEAREDLQKHIQTMSGYASELGKHTKQTHKQNAKTSTRNVKLNAANERYDQAVDSARVNISQMKENGASAKTIAKQEKKLSKIEAKATDEKSLGAYQKQDRTFVRVKATGKVEKLAKSTGKKAAKAVDKTTQATTTRSRMNANPADNSGVTYDVTVEVKMNDQVSCSEAIQSGVGSPALEEITASKINYNRKQTKPAINDFVTRVAKFEEKASADAELVKAIEAIKSAEIPTKYAGKPVTTYRKEVKRKYEEALKEYNESVEQARIFARTYVSQPSFDTLSKVEKEIEKAVLASKKISAIKVECKKDKK